MINCQSTRRLRVALLLILLTAAHVGNASISHRVSADLSHAIENCVHVFMSTYYNFPRECRFMQSSLNVCNETVFAQKPTLRCSYFAQQLFCGNQKWYASLLLSSCGEILSENSSIRAKLSHWANRTEVHISSQCYRLIRQLDEHDCVTTPELEPIGGVIAMHVAQEVESHVDRFKIVRWLERLFSFTVADDTRHLALNDSAVIGNKQALFD